MPYFAIFLFSLYVLVESGHIIQPFFETGNKAIQFQKSDTVSPDSSNHVVKITRSWVLPAELKKISGFDFIDRYRIACIQDEIGTIYIYNTQTNEIERQVPFAPPGDYEALAVVSSTAFIACADGRLFEVANFRSGKPRIQEYGTHLTVKQNVEGLCYDRRNRRLLVSIKGSEEGNQFYKGVYSFDLRNRKMPVQPVVKINLLDTLLNRSNSRKSQSLIQPSDIEIHPSSRQFFLCDASRPQLLKMDAQGRILDVFVFPKSQIIQPEGIRFAPSGELYIVSEGSKEEPGKLLTIEIPSN